MEYKEGKRSEEIFLIKIKCNFKHGNVCDSGEKKHCATRLD